eukprot:CAMPEP_0172469036 /NCGR_PEP_ID=MMETSP1065-20121228/62757_1 /TAXON_ID=265537 /ORGANISM="Amphiprora paludosa, Strain CCMP125" /LENGTH=58 /DNA_ID=CAMNT_0013226573 /DNA_START=121 /DNA_END=294 /DNA_ORIENTATION=+
MVLDHNYSLVHDFRTNQSAAWSHCKDEWEERLGSQETSPGIVMIVEAEEVQVDIKDSK